CVLCFWEEKKRKKSRRVEAIGPVCLLGLHKYVWWLWCVCVCVCVCLCVGGVLTPGSWGQTGPPERHGFLSHGRLLKLTPQRHQLHLQLIDMIAAQTQH